MIRPIAVLAVLTIGVALAQTPRGAGGCRDADGGGSTATLQPIEEGRARDGGIVHVGPGLYTLGTDVHTAGPVTWLFERGAELAGPGQLDAVVDRAVLNGSGLALARVFAAPENEFGLFVSARATQSSGTKPYEKTALISSLVQGDSSDYGHAVLRDLVGYESQGIIAPGIMTGRIWGYNSGVGPVAGADGYAVGGEFGVQSYSGSDAGPLGTPTSKIGVHAVAYGTSTSTAAFLTSGNGTTWQDGYVAQAGAISPGGHAVSVRPTGTARDADLAWLGADGSLGVTRQAELRAGGIGVAQTRMMVAKTGGAGRVEFTDDGGAATRANTVVPGTDSALLIKQAHVLVFDPASGWMGRFEAENVMLPRGVVAGAKEVPLRQQAGTAPGHVRVDIGTEQGRVALVLTTDGAAPLHGVVQMEMLEVR